MSPVISFQGVSKSYPVYGAPADRLKELCTFNQRQFHRDFWALRDISFEVERGETFCILGENGSGKSTLLQIVAGILKPSKGEVDVRGRVAALLELGAGFNPEFTGRDNVYMSAAILGLTKRQIEERFFSIEAFAEIGEFMDRPVKTYSSGMSIRLGFSVAIHCDPEILLVDEALAVGDLYFRQRCLQRVSEMKRRGVTILFVSHAVAEMKMFGDRGLWLAQGTAREVGPIDAVIESYLSAMAEKDSRYEHAHPVPVPAAGDTDLFPGPALTIPNIDHRYGDGRARVLGVTVLNGQGSTAAFLDPLTDATVRVTVEALQDLHDPIVGVTLRNHLGVEFCSVDTSHGEAALGEMRMGEMVTVDFRFSLPDLYPSDFSFSVGIAVETLDAEHMCDWIDNAISLQVVGRKQPVYGYLHVPCDVRLHVVDTPSMLAAGNP